MKRKGIAVLLLVAGLLIVNSVSGLAAPSGLQFFPTKVYFSDDKTLVVEGDFFNESREVVRQIKADVNVKILTTQGWQNVSQSFPNLDVELSAYGAKSWVFKIHGVNKVDISSWKVKTSLF
jgi:hypothetical protein